MRASYARHADARRAYARERSRRIYADPILRAAYLEDLRLRRRMKADEAGRPAPPLTVAQYEARYGAGTDKGTTLPAAPLLAAIDEWLAPAGERTTIGGNGLIDHSERALASTSGVSVRAFNRWRNGARASLVSADRVLTAIGLTLELVYDEAEVS